MPKKTLQRATDPVRAKAAFELGVYSQSIDTPALSKSLLRPRRDIPMTLLELLLGLLRHVDHLCSEIERRRPEPLSFVEKVEMDCRFAEVRELAESALPQFCELRPLFDLGRALGALRRVVEDLNREKGNGPVTAKEIRLALALEQSNAESCEALAHFPEIEAIWDRVRTQLPRPDEIQRLVEDACTKLEEFSVVKASDFLDALIGQLRDSVCGVAFDTIAQDQLRHARNSWLFDLAKKCPNSVELAKALEDKRDEQPVGAKWDPCDADGIRDALNAFALREGVPPIDFPIGRPRGKAPPKSRSKAENHAQLTDRNRKSR
ncbi:MAG: hypothetical protein ACKV2Q_09630 [Planctomycetaceae bacterium]